MVLRNLAEPAHITGHFGLIEYPAEIQAPRFPMIDRFPDFETIDTANHLVHLAEPKLSHHLADFFSDEPHEIDRVLGLTHESLAQFRVLSRDAHRAGVEMTYPHEDAAERHERRSRKPKFLGAQQSRNHHIASGLELPIRLDNDARA